MTDATSTAKVLKIVATQTKLIKQADARTQTANKKVDTQAPLIYDLTQDDKSEQLATDIEMESEYESNQVQKRNGKIFNLLVEHFENRSPGSMNIAHVMASSSHIPPNMEVEGIQLNEPNKRSHEEEHEPKGRRGRPRQKHNKVKCHQSQC